MIFYRIGPPCTMRGVMRAENLAAGSGICGFSSLI